MPIVVSARLVREAGVFLAGEAVECEITVRNRRDTSVPFPFYFLQIFSNVACRI